MGDSTGSREQHVDRACTANESVHHRSVWGASTVDLAALLNSG